MLRNPTYAGAYTHGRYQQDVRRRHNGSPGTGRYLAEIEDWRVLIHDNFPAYISWPQYVANRAKLKANRVRFYTSGTPRDGRALLAGIVFCGRCGRKMFTHYKATKRSPAYVCQGEHLQRAASMCQRLIS